MFRIIVFLLFIPTVLIAQGSDTAFAKAQSFQNELNNTYKNPDSTILSKKQLRKFKGLEFWDIDMKYRVEATFERTTDAIPFNMSLSSGKTREYVQYGIAVFNIDEQEYTLPIYQNTYFRDHPEVKYGNSLFLPFTDYTSGDGSYGGGRYIDLVLEDIQEGKLTIDFNQAYNPYCAYTEGYSCPIPPESNDIKVRIEAGVKDFGKH